MPNFAGLLDVTIRFKNNRKGFLKMHPVRRAIGSFFMRLAAWILDCDIDIDAEMKELHERVA
jgi:hypothetical protein